MFRAGSFSGFRATDGEKKGGTAAELIKEAAFSFALAAVVGGLMLAVFPDCGARKTFRAAVLAFVLSCAVSPLARLSGDFVPQIDAGGLLQGEIAQNAVNGAQKVIAENIAAALNEAGLEFDAVDVSASSDADGRLYISEIRVKTANSENREKLYEFIQSNFGITPVLGE